VCALFSLWLCCDAWCVCVCVCVCVWRVVSLFAPCCFVAWLVCVHAGVCSCLVWVWWDGCTLAHPTPRSYGEDTRPQEEKMKFMDLRKPAAKRQLLFEVFQEIDASGDGKVGAVWW